MTDRYQVTTRFSDGQIRLDYVSGGYQDTYLNRGAPGIRTEVIKFLGKVDKP